MIMWASCKRRGVVAMLLAVGFLPAPLESRIVLAADPALQAVAQSALTDNGVTVDYVEYPLAHDNARPWSQWGKGLVQSRSWSRNRS